jgi:hypothetical protein
MIKYAKKLCGILTLSFACNYSQPIFADPFDSNICNALHELAALAASKLEGYDEAEQNAIKACASDYYTSQYKKNNFKCKSEKDFLAFLQSLARRAKVPTTSLFNVQMVGVSCILKTKTIDN